MAEAKLYGQNKGGMSINGIIKDYYAYAGEKISAGDLVEYINGVAGKTDYGESVDTAISELEYKGYTTSAVALDENRVFIAHSYSNSYHLYGIVCTINGATITYGEDTVIEDYATSSVNYNGLAISIELLPNGNVFIAHSKNSPYHLYGIVVSINGTTITKGTDTAIAAIQQYSGRHISTCLLPNGDVFIAHSYGSSYHLYGIVVSIDGLTITVGSDTGLVTGANAGSVISTCLLPDGRVFIAHSQASNYSLYGITATIDGTKITYSSNKQLTSMDNSGMYISTCLLPNGNVFIAHSSGSNYYLYGMVCTISGGITPVTDARLSDLVGAGDSNPKTLLLPNNNVFVIHGDNTSSNYLYGAICSIENTTTTVGVDTLLINSDYACYGVSSLLLNNGTIFIAHSHTKSMYYLYAQIFAIENNIPTNHIIANETETQVRKVTTGQFDGVAKTSGEGGDDTGHNDIVSIWTKE